MAFGDESRLHRGATDTFAIRSAERCGDAIECVRFVIEAKDVGGALVDASNRVKQFVEMRVRYQLATRVDCRRLGRTLSVRFDLEAVVKGAIEGSG